MYKYTYLNTYIYIKIIYIHRKFKLSLSDEVIVYHSNYSSIQFEMEYDNIYGFIKIYLVIDLLPYVDIGNLLRSLL